MNDVHGRIEAWFEKMARTLYRHRLKTLVVMCLLIAGIVSQIPKITLDTSTEGFLHATDPALIDYNAFRDQFGRDEMIMVAVNPPDVFDSRFLKKLKSLHNDLRDKVPFLEDITSLINARNTRGEQNDLIVEDLLENMPETPEALAAVKARALENPMYRNTLLSEDGKFTTIILKTQRYSSIGKESDVLEGFDGDDKVSDGNGKKKRPYLTDPENSEVIRAVRSVVSGYDAPDFKTYIAGSPVVTHYMKQSMMKDMRKFMALAVLTIAVFLLFMFRRISGVILPLLVVILSLLSTIGLMAALGVPIKVPTQILPSFLLAVCVGDSVHILAIFYQQLRNGQGKEDAVAHAIGHSGLAVFMTSATTAGGLVSFATADIAPVADLGIYAGIGAMIAFVFTLVLLPPVLSLIPIAAKAGKNEKPTSYKMDRIVASVGRISTTHPYAIVFLSAAIVAVSLVGAAKIRFSHDILGWFPKQSDERMATEKIDREMRGSIALEVILDTGKENGLYDPDILNRLEKSATTVESLSFGEIFAGKAFSLTIILKEINRALNENRKEFYTIPQDRMLVAQEFLLFENSGSDDLEDFTDSQFRKARFTIKAPFKDAVAYSRFIDVVNTHFRKEYPEASITVTGMMALLFRTIHNMIISMAQSYVTSFVVVTILMVLLIGRMRIGLLSMVPNIAPIIITLGIMGFFRIPMDLFTMLVGNIAIGLAVDDTIHFLHNFRRYFEESHDAVGAIMETMHTTGQAMLVTSLVMTAGFFIFMFASMNNVFYFGLLSGLTIIIAVLAEFFLTPAVVVLAYRNAPLREKAGRFQPEKIVAAQKLECRLCREQD